jgi:peptidoglycan/LPS O-acetylase OafA/YrhL
MTSLFVDRTAGTGVVDTGFVDTAEIDVREIRAAIAADQERDRTPQEPAPERGQEPAQEPAPAAPRQRDRYIDTLRAVALVRVMTYHAFGWAWLPLLFPSMGIMFALAGSLVAGSLDRSPGNPWRVLRKRTVRLLPPVWLFGLVVVPVMLLAGWTHTAEAGSPLHLRTLLLWVLPISDPPGSALGEDWVLPLWYIRTYLWFLLLSPMVLWLFRHWPKRMLALPVAAVALWTVGVLPMDGRSGDVLLSLGTFGACWLLGFAHHDGSIRRLPALPVVAGGLAVMGLGLAYALTHPDPATGYDIDNIPLADMLYCLGAVLVLLRLYPDFSWMARYPVVDRLVAVVNSRAMTIYLWGNLAIFLANPLLDLWSVTAELDQENWVGATQAYLAAWLVLVGCVLAFGWCEDLAARRPVRFNPWPRTPGQLSVLRQLRTFAAPGGVRIPRVAPQRLVIGTAALVVAATALSALVLVGTRTPARTAAGDVQSRVAAQPRPEVSRSDAGPGRTPGTSTTLTPAPVLPPDGGTGAPGGSGAGAAPAAGSAADGTLPRPRSGPGTSQGGSAAVPQGSPTASPRPTARPTTTTPRPSTSAPAPTTTAPDPTTPADPPPSGPTPSAPAPDPTAPAADPTGAVDAVTDVLGSVGVDLPLP